MNLIKNFKLKYNNFLFLWSLAIGLNIIALCLIFFQNGLNGNNVALKYSVNIGVLWYGGGNHLLALPTMGILMTLINYLIFTKLKPTSEFLANTIVIINTQVQLILFISLLFLASIN